MLTGAADAQSPAPPPVDQGARWRHYPQDKAAPQGAPNVLLVMTDDVGFGASSPFVRS